MIMIVTYNFICIGIYDSNTGNIKSVQINPSLTLKLNEPDRRLAITYAKELKNIGKNILKCNIMCISCILGIKVSCKHEMLLVSELPAILTERDIAEKQKMKLAQDLILNHLEVTIQDMYSNQGFPQSMLQHAL